MKITNAWIGDPLLAGIVAEPRLVVEVTELPDVSIEPASFNGGWEVGKYGPFVRYTCSRGTVTAADFNMRFRDRFPVIVDVVLSVVGRSDVPDGTFDAYSLPLTRARQLLRKHDRSWRLLVSDRAAESGSLLWLPIESNPACRHFAGNSICGRTPARVVHSGHVPLPLCSDHLVEHNRKTTLLRKSS